jgi:hypothetical protein
MRRKFSLAEEAEEAKELPIGKEVSEAPRPYGRGISPNASRSLMRNPSEAGAKESIDTAHFSPPSRAGPPAKGG